MIKKIIIGILVFFIFPVFYSFAEKLPDLPKGPLLLTSVTKKQLTPDYWINRLPNPEKVIKTRAEVKKFNEEIHRMISERKDVFQLPLSIAGSPIKKQIEFEYTILNGRKLFDINDERIPDSLFVEEIKPVLGLEEFPKRIKMKWGVVVKATSIRALPTDKKMLEGVGDIEFDQLQFTLIKLWTPVGIFHQSSDKKWYYVQAPYVRGWVKAEDIALFESRDELMEYAKNDSFIVVTGESIPIYSNSSRTNVAERPTMGTILPFNEETKGNYVVLLPKRGEEGKVLIKNAYVSKRSDVSRGFLPYSQANIIRQAFKLLGARYGWGGMYNGRDCSGFTHDVFLSLGIDMPRDSKQQGFVGTPLSHFEAFGNRIEKKEILRSGGSGMTLLRMPLHIMIYLGEVKGKFYIIHSTWAERISMTSDEKVRINQVVVSDLSLNGKSRMGALFDRVLSINEVN